MISMTYQRLREREMAEENKVVLYGTWFSPFVKRVEIALKVKGVAFEYVEEDLKNKSPSLLQYNPVHKKVPVLVHNGKPIAESLVILEYVDETWTNSPLLLPQDSYRRAKIRFWVSFLQQQVLDKMMATGRAEGEARDEPLKEALALLKVFEGGLKEFLADDTPFVNGNELGLLEIVMVSLFGPYKAQEEGLGFKVIDEEKTPLIYSWLNAIIEHPIGKETSLPHEKALAFYQSFRQKQQKSAAS